ncbi:DUF5809 family protein [Halobaculum sp. P14]|uniref:DUF5809 family protein n=1 Tax=Halobaculum sp. P14 TaxID=3421638 RepID=UPI003EBCDAC8
METEGTLAPESPEAARDEYDALVPTAKVAVRETAKAMEFDRDEYSERVTGDVVETVRDALFASLLRVHVGSREEFDDWLDDHPSYDADVIGSGNVGRVVWHPVPFADVVVAATWENEREAALGTLRRHAFGDVYREHLDGDEDSGGEDSGGEDSGGDDKPAADGPADDDVASDAEPDDAADDGEP